MQQITIEYGDLLGICVMVWSLFYFLGALVHTYQAIVTSKLRKETEELKIELERMKNGEKFDEYGLPILGRDIPMPKVKEPILENQFEIRLD